MFLQLPNELLDNVIIHTIPESFESVALTCKRIYARGKVFIKRYHELRVGFQDFEYNKSGGQSIISASDLLLLIAAEPVVARYIRSATFETDSQFLFYQTRRSVPSIQEGGAVIELFADSTYLKQANLDWKEYYATFEAEVRERRYSQHGAAFLLTLLPNIEKITIPAHWKPNDATEKLLDVIVDRAKAKQSTSSLAIATRFKIVFPPRPGTRDDLRWASPFLALPHMRYFYGLGCSALEDIPRSLAFRNSHFIAKTLQTVDFSACYIDEVGITDFLKHTPCLTTLKYSHCMKYQSPVQDWDICTFVNAIEREAGSRLVQLAITILRGSVVPGKASIRGCQRLKTLQIPLELVMCNIVAAASQPTNRAEPFVDLIPTSVVGLSLVSDGTDQYAEALDALVRHFCSTHDSPRPTLQELQISCPHLHAGDLYKAQHDRVVKEFGDISPDISVYSCSPNTSSWGREYLEQYCRLTTYHGL
jgi:hypothetical protein